MLIFPIFIFILFIYLFIYLIYNKDSDWDMF